MSIIKGAQEPRQRQEVVRLGAHAAAQKLGAASKSYQVPSNKNTPMPPEAPNLADHQADQLRLRQIRLVGGAQAAPREMGQRGQEAPRNSLAEGPHSREPVESSGNGLPGRVRSMRSKPFSSAMTAFCATLAISPGGAASACCRGTGQASRASLRSARLGGSGSLLGCARLGSRLRRLLVAPADRHSPGAGDGSRSFAATIAKTPRHWLVAAGRIGLCYLIADRASRSASMAGRSTASPRSSAPRTDARAAWVFGAALTATGLPHDALPWACRARLVPGRRIRRLVDRRSSSHSSRSSSSFPVFDDPGERGPGQSGRHRARRVSRAKFFDRLDLGTGLPLLGLCAAASPGTPSSSASWSASADDAASASPLRSSPPARTSGYKTALRILSVLPIITPPFVIGLALILLFGRSGAVSALLSDWLRRARGRAGSTACRAC